MTRPKAREKGKPSRSDNPLQLFEKAVDDRKERLQEQMAKHINRKAQVESIFALARANDDLLEAITVNPASVLSCLFTACRTGLDLNPHLKHCYLVPFRDKHVGWTVQLITDKRGLIAAAVRAGVILDADGFVVREGDHFTSSMRVVGGRDESFYEHIPRNEEEGEKGRPMTHVVAWALLPNGVTKWRAIPAWQINKRRAMSKRKTSGPWQEWEEEMDIKTGLKMLFSTIPINTDFAEVLDVGEEYATPREVEGEWREAKSSNTAKTAKPKQTAQPRQPAEPPPKAQGEGAGPAPPADWQPGPDEFDSETVTGQSGTDRIQAAYDQI